MSDAPLSGPKYTAVQEKVQAFFDELISSGELGRRKCAHEENWDECEVEDCTYEDTQQESPQMVTQFVAILQYASMTRADEGDYGMVNSVRLPRTSRVGMLSCALEDW